MKNNYKLAMIGFGSIAKRHLMNLNKLFKTNGKKYSVDLLRRKESKALEPEYAELIDTIYFTIDEMPSDYDAVFITNPTNLHYDTISKFTSKCQDMFIEKPVFDNCNLDIEALDLKSDSNYYVACPMRYTKVLQYLKKHINLGEVYSVRTICSSYLPNWRPTIDYRQNYSAHLAEGGGVSIDLIHEWDYLIYLFGKPESIHNYRGQFSHLEIDSDDVSIYIAKYNTMLVELHLDYIGRKPIREIQLFTKEDTIVADLINSEIRFLKSKKVISFAEERDDYQLAELANFFAIISAERENENDIDRALMTLKIAKEGRI